MLRLRASILLFAALAACSGDDAPLTTPPAPVLKTINVTATTAAIMQNQSTTVAATTADQNGSPLTGVSLAWSSSAPAVASVDQTGKVTGMSVGTAQVFASSNGVVGQVAITVNAPPAIRFNEVESNGGFPGDWAELFNPTNAAVDISGYIFKDNDDTHNYVVPNGTSIPAGGYFLLEEAAFGFGLGAPDAVRLYTPFAVLVDSYGWSAHATTTYARCANNPGFFATATSSTKGTANDCSVPVRINEVESSGGTPGDWVELYNPSPVAVDLSGFIFRDDDDTHNYTIPNGTVIAAGAFLVLDEAQIVFGLGAADAARLFTPTGTLVDSYSWTAHAATTYGRCADGSGAFVTTASPTKGTANFCSGSISAAAWPTLEDVATVDNTSTFGPNMSGLTYEAASGGNPAVLWAVKNGPGTLYRLILSNGAYVPDPANGWSVGKPLRYTDGSGDPDAEGVTFGTASAGGIYVATERNNSNNAVSKNAILRFDPSSAGVTLTATHEWNLTADLPVTGANLGAEAITFIPDAFLTSQGFFDELANKAYNPADYANHAGGLFFVGLEANGMIYAYALDHTNSTFKRVATIATPFPGVMGFEFDRELNYFWAVCDDGCAGRAAVLEIDTKAGATKGKFLVTKVFDRPVTMPNINNEGFAIAPQSECVNGRKPAFWSDDSETGGHAIRRGTLTCSALP